MQRVVVYHKPGDASVLQVEERHIPKRGDGEVLIKQYSASVNPVDYKMRTSNKEHLPKVGQARFRVQHGNSACPTLLELTALTRKTHYARRFLVEI